MNLRFPIEGCFLLLFILNFSSSFLVYNGSMTEIKRIVLFASLAVISIFLFVGLSLSLTLFILSRDLPQIIEKKDYKPWLTTEVYSSEGVKIGEFLEHRRYLVEAKDLPENLKKAFVA